MERRTLLAILLIMAVLIADQILWPRLTGRHRPVRPSTSADSTSSSSGGELRAVTPTEPSPGTVTAPTSPAGSGESAGPAVAGLPGGATGTRPRVPSAPVEQREIRTRAFLATFTSEGGTVSSWVLPDYPDLARAKEPVNLVKPGLRAMRVIVTTAQFAYDFTDAPFRLVEAAGDSAISFVAEDSSGVRVVKTYRATRDPHTLEVELRVSVPPQFGSFEYRWGWGSALPHTETRVDPHVIQAAALIGDRMETYDAPKLQKSGPKDEKGNVRWAADRSKYFVAALIPDSATVGQVVFAPSPTREPTVWLLGAAPPGTQSVARGRLYAGPIHYDTLVAQGAELDRLANLGWRWLTGVSALLLWCLNALHKLIPNYGVAIILLSAATKLVFYPLNQASLRSMKVMHHLQPEMKAIQDRYKGDPQRMNQAMMELYKRHKVNPLSGCLPMLIPIPVFFALYNVLLNSIELRGAGFVGYIQDLSLPDVFLRLGGFPIHLLPLLMTGSTFMMQSQTPIAPAQKPMMMVMPLMMLVFMYNFPSGVILYWTVTNILSAVQQYLVNLAEDRKMAASA